MTKTFAEIKDDLRFIREDIYRNAEKLDPKLLASYLDRMILSLEDLTDSLDVVDNEMDALCGCVECEEPAVKKPVGAKSKKPKTSAKKKPVKKGKAKKRR